MAKSPLFGLLARLAKHPQLARPRPLDPSHVVPAPATIGRRELMVGVASAVALAPLVTTSAACGDNDLVEVPLRAAVGVIGAGLAGLLCADQLKQAGVDTLLFEASGRAGGRMFSLRDGLPSGQNIELGGELIDTGHTAMRSLVQDLGLTLDDLPLTTQGLASTFFFDGAVVDEAEILREFEPVAAKMAMAVEATTASQAEYARIDAMNISQWLADEANLPPTSLLRRLLELAYTEEYGLAANQQSVMNLLALIDYETTDEFLIFGDSDERFHVHQGNDAVTAALASNVATITKLGHELVAVTAVKGGYQLAFTVMAEGGAATRTALVERVVYALPFSTLRLVDLTNAGLTAEKLAMINSLGYGTNAKLMLRFSAKPWQTGARKANGGCITDEGELQSTWDTSRGQPGTTGIITNFVGGTRGETIGSDTAEAQAANVLPWFDTVFPGSQAAYLSGSAVRMHWPTVPTMRGSYACYLPGQWTAFFGKEGLPEGNAHFCGEHCSMDYQGYMEGAAETGLLVAAAILEELGMPRRMSPALAAVVADKLRVAQPCFERHPLASTPLLTLHQRRAILRAARTRAAK